MKSWLGVVIGVSALGAAAVATAQTSSPALNEALARARARSVAEDGAADAARAANGHWSGSAPRAQAGGLEAGQDLTNAERAALSDACHKVARSKVLSAYVRVDVGAPHPRITCKLASGKLVTVGFGKDNEPYRIK
jgi:hypothetical protein